MDYQKSTVVQLRSLLTERGLPTSGKKDELIKRLIESDDSVHEATKVENVESPKLPASPVNEVTQESPKPSTDMKNEEEKRKYRAERFGIELSEAEKKKIRMARFQSSPLGAQEREKLEKRKERFGVISPALQKDEELKKKQQRAERFK